MTHDIDFKSVIAPPMPRDRSMRIGCIGSGFIMNDCHLVAYGQAGFNAYALSSRTRTNADAAAKRHGIGVVYDDWHDLVADPQVQILDIAIPPDLQVDVIRAAAREASHIRGIQAQKPLAMSLEEAREGVAIAAEAGIALSVNSNMRYDQSIRALKTLIDRGVLGDVVLATIEMRAVPHWQEFLRKYRRVEIINMGIHHVDAFRYLFGDPEKITALTRRDPRTTFDHIDGITQYTFQYANGVMATSLDDVWTGPRGDCADDIYIKWRVEGTEGLAQGTIGWPKYPARTPSTLSYASRATPHTWISPSWDAVWFPDAFAGPMSQLMRAVEDGREPELSGRDNLHTLACVEACYRSIAEERTVRFDEFTL